MAWKRYTIPLTVTGPGRIAVNSVVAADPTSLPAMIDIASYDFNAANNWTDLGPTDGGITLEKGFTTTKYGHDLGNDIALDVVTNTMTVATVLAEAGLVSRFNYSWLTQTGTTSIDTGASLKKGIAAAKTLLHRSVIAAELDRSDRVRVFFLRDCTNNDGTAQYQMQLSTIHKLAVNLIAYQNTANVDNEFGWLYQDTNFGT